jgi:DNA replicative helicase MCM subunit Mcm2 (Cdc46/Mcm family)
VRVFNLRRLCNMRDINPEDIDRLVAIRGTHYTRAIPSTGR